MKFKRVATTVGTDLFLFGLVFAGLALQVEWAWNIFLFLFWVLFIAGLLFASYIYNSEHGKDRVREYAPEKFTRCVWPWWNYLTTFGTGCLIAAHGYFFTAAMWVACWVTNEVIFDKVKELRAEIAKESEFAND